MSRTNITKRKNYRYSYGLKYLLSNHKHIRKLKRKYIPTNHGNKIWTTSWLLIDYIHRTNNISGHRVLDIGCGWGIAGIYCAKKHDAKVTCIDMDEKVFPFLKLLAETNQVKVRFLCKEINNIKRSILNATDLIIASDICFSNSLIDQLRRLIQRAKMASVKEIIISDPGRWPFDKLTDLYKTGKNAKIDLWKTNRPHYTTGKILSIKY
jgi:predicted nicotinamide N-methyase